MLRRSPWFLSFVLLSLLPTGCDGSDGEGANPGECSDGADNDSDGDYDCDDADCSGSPDCEAASGDNAAPSGAAIAIDPAAPVDDDELACTIVTEAVDPNGDEVTYGYAWAVDGADAGLTTATVAASLTSGGQTWTCTVTPTDGTLEGTPATASATIAIGNQAPSAPTVSISPTAPSDVDVLTCVIEEESVDPEGAEVTYTYAWSVDGADAGITDATVTGSLTTRGQTWTCSVTGTDGEDTSTPGSASVEIASCGEPEAVGGIDFTAVCGGTFEMGCSDDSPNCESDEVPVHSVTLTNNFLMGVTEVTQTQFSEIMGEDPSYFTSCGSDCPVERVSWHVAASFANALSEEAGLSSCYSCSGSGSSVSCTESGTPYACDGFRLPTSAEWEAAARCETDTHFAGSDDIEIVGWYEYNSFGMTHPVGELLPNACGIYDLTGNVWEWVNDWYMPYSSDPATDPVQPVGAHREFRGGSYDAGPSDSHISARGGIDPTYSAPNYGIRLVRTIQ